MDYQGAPTSGAGPWQNDVTGTGSRAGVAAADGADVDVVRVAFAVLRAGVAVADGEAEAVQHDIEVAVVAVLTDHTAPRLLTV